MTPETVKQMPWYRIKGLGTDADYAHNLPLWRALGEYIVNETKSKDEAYRLCEAACLMVDGEDEANDNRNVDNTMYYLIDEMIEEQPRHW